MSSYRPSIQIIIIPPSALVSSCLPEILDWSFWLGCFAKPHLEEGEAVGVGDGTVRKSVGEFL